jgi:hypothetical protein
MKYNYHKLRLIEKAICLQQRFAIALLKKTGGEWG